jgi:hypothetical protein
MNKSFEEIQKEKISRLYNNTERGVTITEVDTTRVQKSLISQAYPDILEKGGKRATIGEVRIWDGVKVVKHQDGWVILNDKTNKHVIELPGGKRVPATHEHIKHADDHLARHNREGGGLTAKNEISEEVQKHLNDNTTTGEDGIHSHAINGSTRYSMPGETKESFHKRIHSDVSEDLKKPDTSSQEVNPLHDEVRSWVGKFTNSEIDSVIDALSDAGIEESDLRLRRTPNYTPEVESEQIHSVTQRLLGLIRLNTTEATLSKHQVRDIIEGLVRTKRSTSLPIFSKKETTNTETAKKEPKPDKNLDRYKSLTDRDRLEVNGITHKLNLIRHPKEPYNFESYPSFSVKITHPVTGEISVIPNAIKYHTGYDQGYNSRQQYYPDVAGYGTHNGDGYSSPSEPYLSPNEREHLASIFSGVRSEYNDTKNNYQDSIRTYPKGTKNEDIKRDISGY